MSDDLRPPSLRDTRSLTDVVRHHSLVLEKLAPGLFGGRSRIPDPLDLSDDLAADGDPGGDGDTDEPDWWDEDRYIVTGPISTLTWVLTYAVVPESLFIRWHPAAGAGLPQISPEDWTLGDDGQTVTIRDPDGILAAGDTFSAQYQFLDIVGDPPPPPPPTLDVIGYTEIYDGDTTVAVPAGTAVGDLLVLALQPGFFTPAAAADWLTTSYTGGSGQWILGYAIHDGSATYPVTLSSGTSDSAGLLVAVRTTATITPVVTNGSGNPVVTGAASGVLGVTAIVGSSGVVAGGFTSDSTDSTGHWTLVDAYGDDKTSVLIGVSANPPADASWSVSTGVTWHAMTLGLS